MSAHQCSLSLCLSLSVFLPSPSFLFPFSGVQLQFLPCLPGAHGVCWGAELPAAASRRRQQPDLARRPWPEDSTHTHRQTTAAARHRGHSGINTIHTNEPKAVWRIFLHCMWMTFKCVVAYEISCAGCSSELNRLDQNKHEKRKKASEAQTILGFTAVKSFVHNLSLILDFPATGQSQQLSKINHALFLLQSILRAVARGQFSQFDILVCLTFQWLMNMYNNDIQMKIYCTNTLYSTKKLTTSAVSYQMVLDEPLKGQCEGFIWCCWLEKLDPIPKLTLDIMEDHHQCLYI